MPPGVELTVPLPFTITVSVCMLLPLEKLAVTFCAESIVTTQLPVPVQAPPPATEVAAGGFGCRGTLLVRRFGALDWVGEVVPPGVDCTWPLPVMLTVNVCGVLLPPPVPEPPPVPLPPPPP